MQRSRSILIDRPIEEVFAYIDDPKKTPEWAEGMVETIVDTSRPRGVGALFQVRIKEGPKVNTYDGVVIDHAPNEVVGSRLSRDGKHMMDLHLRVRPRSGATEVTQEVDVPMKGAVVLMAPLVWLMTRSIQRKQMAKLKEILEKPR